jgi:hypothetical protein
MGRDHDTVDRQASPFLEPNDPVHSLVYNSDGVSYRARNSELLEEMVIPVKA